MSTIFTKSACLSRQRLEGYVQGTLDRPTVREVEHHLNDCPLCSQAVEGMKMLQPSTLSIPKKSTSNKKWLVWLFVLLFAIAAILLGNWYMQQRDSIQKIIADYNAQTFAIVQRNSEATASLKTHILNGNYDLAQKSLQTLAPLPKDQPDIQAINWVIQLQTGKEIDEGALQEFTKVYPEYKFLYLAFLYKQNKLQNVKLILDSENEKNEFERRLYELVK